MKPVGNTYLVKRITTKEKNQDNVYSNNSPLPSSGNDGIISAPKTEDMKGTVVALPTLDNKEDKHICKVGDKIIFNYGNPITIDGTEYHLVSRYDIKIIL